MSTVAVALGLASPPDLLRLALVPVFAWAAYRDVRTRRLPNRLWPPLYAAGGLLLAWEAWLRWPPGGVGGRPFAIRVAVSLLVVAPLGYLLWRLGGFGGADAKALIALAIAVPTFPTYFLPGTALPLVVTPLGVFSLTVLTNAALLAAAYPVALAVRNALAGRLRPAMFLARPIQIDRLSTAHGRLFETRTGTTRRGLDLDALRMYLRWRGDTLAELRADPDGHRNPGSLPEAPNPPGDGSIPTDGSEPGEAGTPSGPRSDGGEPVAPVDQFGTAAAADPWGAERFLDDIEGSAYGTAPEQLREGLELLARTDEVWISPGIPFLVPMFFGLLISLVYGDMLYSVLSAAGFA